MFFHPNNQLYFVNHNKKSNKMKQYIFNTYYIIYL
jgi:hypothetical protein